MASRYGAGRRGHVSVTDPASGKQFQFSAGDVRQLTIERVLGVRADQLISEEGGVYSPEYGVFEGLAPGAYTVAGSPLPAGRNKPVSVGPSQFFAENASKRGRQHAAEEAPANGSAAKDGSAINLRPSGGLEFRRAWRLESPGEGVFVFKAKGSGALRVALSARADPNERRCEIVISEQDGVVQVRGKADGPVEMEEYGEFLDADSLETFWICVNESAIVLGGGAAIGKNIYLSYAAKLCAEVEYIGFAAESGSVSVKSVRVRPLNDRVVDLVAKHVRIARKRSGTKKPPANRGVESASEEDASDSSGDETVDTAGNPKAKSKKERKPKYDPSAGLLAYVGTKKAPAQSRVARRRRYEEKEGGTLDDEVEARRRELEDLQRSVEQAKKEAERQRARRAIRLTSKIAKRREQEEALALQERREREEDEKRSREMQRRREVQRTLDRNRAFDRVRQRRELDALERRIAAEKEHQHEFDMDADERVKEAMRLEKQAKMIARVRAMRSKAAGSAALDDEADTASVSRASVSSVPRVRPTQQRRSRQKRLEDDFLRELDMLEEREERLQVWSKKREMARAELNPLERLSSDSHDAVGTLRITVHEGESLAVRDLNGFSDPYVRVVVGGKTGETRVVKRSLNPRWEQTLLFRGVSSREIIHVFCFDKDTMKKDDRLGQVDVAIADILRLGAQSAANSVSWDGWFDLEQIETGSLRLSFVYEADGVEVAGGRTSTPEDPLVQAGARTRSPLDFDTRTERVRRSEGGMIHGTLTLQLKEAADLPPRDSNGKSDPFVEVVCGKQRRKTKVKSKTLNPAWNETFTLQITDAETADVTLNVYDYDVIGKNDPMGDVSINVADLLEVDQMDEWLELQNVESGTIHVVASFLPDSEVAASNATVYASRTGGVKGDDDATLKGDIVVKVLEGAALASRDSNGLSDPYVEIELQKKRFKTKTIKKTLSPTWNETFTFKVEEARGHDRLHFRVMDWDRIGKDDEMGVADVFLQDIVDAPGKTFEGWVELQDVESGRIHVHISYLAIDESGIDRRLARIRGGADNARVQRTSFSSAVSEVFLADDDNLRLTREENFVRGSLMVTVAEGKDLAARDKNGLSDPFVEVVFGKKKQKTKVIDKTLNPSWDETFSFDMDRAILKDPDSYVEFRVKDKDRFGTDSMGVARVPLHDISIDTEEDRWLELTDVESGSILVSLGILEK